MHTCATFNSTHNQMLEILGVLHILGVDFSLPNELTSFIIYLGINISVYSNWRKPTCASRCSCRHVGSSSLIMLSPCTAVAPCTIIYPSLEKRLMANLWYCMCPWTKPQRSLFPPTHPECFLTPVSLLLWCSLTVNLLGNGKGKF